MSLRKAIDQNCKDCIYDPKWAGGGSWRQQVEDCTAKNCALWPVSPLTSAGNAQKAAGSARSKAMKGRHRDGVFERK